MEDNKNIKAFAFHTGIAIENLINKETDNLREENQLLQAKILEFYFILKEIGYELNSCKADEKYKDYFNIETKRHGEL
jgi:hypothetical protein